MKFQTSALHFDWIEGDNTQGIVIQYNPGGKDAAITPENPNVRTVAFAFADSEKGQELVKFLNLYIKSSLEHMQDMIERD